MSSIVTSNVFRFSALFGGVAYGFYHQRSIWSTQATQAAERKWQHQESIIEKAKKEYKVKNDPTYQAGSGVITNPDDPKFDLEAYLKSKEQAS